MRRWAGAVHAVLGGGLPSKYGPRLCSLVAVFAVSGMLACSAVRPAAPSPGTELGPIRLGLPPARRPETALGHGAPLARLVERESGLRVTVTVPTSQETAVDALGAGSLDAAWLSPFAYVVARDRRDVDVLLGSTRDGSPIESVQISVPGEQGRQVAKQLPAPIPRDALVGRPALAASTHEALRAGLLRVAATDEGRRLLAGLLGADGLVPLTDADFDPVRQAARALDLGPDRLLVIAATRQD